MKKLYFLLIVAIFSLCCINVSFAQIVGGDVFLQGQWLEVGVDNMGAFGTCTSPTGYHVHGPLVSGSATCSDAGDALDACYDWGHDGWGVGTPCEMGDYTIPGYPQEGWGIQIGATEYRNWAGGGTCSGSFDITGSITGYSNAGGIITGTFTGTAGGLRIVQETRVDTESSWAVVTTRMYNTTGAAISGVYYERTCDPDNTSFWPGGTSETENVIVHQNEDATHRVMVGTYGTTSVYNRYNSYMGLATKDCRAKAFVIEDVAPSYSDLYPEPGTTPSEIWSGAANFMSGLGDSDYDDVGIVLVVNIGTIAAMGTPGDSAVVSYAYVYDGSTGVDSAFPDPQLVVNNVAVPNNIEPYPTSDTLNTCSIPGVLLVPVGIKYATDKDWTWSTWTWSPSTGLAATTGVTNTVNVTLLTGPITYTITGTDSAMDMFSCNHRIFYLTILPCHSAYNNGPCLGDSLLLVDHGDSTGATYAWHGPGGFFSTLQNPFIYPATYADSGVYYVIKTVGFAHDTDSTDVIIHAPLSVTATSNAPLCSTNVDTLLLSALPYTAGETFTWSGPGGYSSSVEFASVTPFGAAQTGIYKVVTTSSYGCKDSATTNAQLVPPPPAPVIIGPTFYCQNSSFVPFIITDSSGTVLDSDLLWYLVPTGGIGTTTPLTITTTIPGYYTIYVSRKMGSCEGPRATFSVRVKTTPPAPLVTGIMQYCQGIGPDVPVSVHTAVTDTIKWYTVSTGGVPSLIADTPNIYVVPPGGSYTFWVSQTDSGCESPRQMITITIHPKPSPPVVHPQPWCQFMIPSPVSATPSETGDNLLWYGPGHTAGTSSAPTPVTLIAPDTFDYYVTETSSFGCVSDSALDAEIIIKQPAPPVTSNVSYCQQGVALALNAEVDSAANSMLQWYFNGTLLPGAPVPPTDTTTGNTTWYVTQTVNTCQSDSATVVVTIIYKPVFGITATQPWVCQFDSLNLSYNGPDLVYPQYLWTLPTGASLADGTHITDPSIVVVFDSAVVNNYVYLTAVNDSGKCPSDTSIRINIVSQPTAVGYTKPDVCLGDTVSLALITRADDAASYAWYVDYIALLNSSSVSIISSNSNSGGPFSISWVDSGRHIIEVQSFSAEGCRSAPTYDTIDVHMIPDAHFTITSTNQSGCIDDTVQFTAAAAANYNDSYVWSPAHSFDNVNQPVAWGRIEEANTIISLTVTDPYGCTATESMEIDPNSCCTVFMPNAFTPNGDTKNDFFRPVYNGYHRFHVFRVVNRWGQTVFNSENSGMQWDGNWNGVPQDMGTYFYYLKYDCGGKTIEQKGDVTLIR